MIAYLDPLREFTFSSVCLRLVLPILFAGMLGMNRAKKGRAAGFRTYMIVCMGASLTILISQYYVCMLEGPWREAAEALDLRTDGSRLGAQVINGIGFLAAGTILVTGRQEVKGLTTAAGLWACACMGLAIGIGFYECVLLAFVYIMVSIQLLPWLESFIMEHSRNMNLYIEFSSLDSIGQIITQLKDQDVRIYSVDIDRGSERMGQKPSALFSIRLKRSRGHERILTALTELSCVTMIDEV